MPKFAISFIEALEVGDAINVDDNFIRYFYLNTDECEDDDDVLLDADAMDGDYNLYEYRFTKKECEDARYSIEKKEWTVGADDNIVTVYNINKIEQS